MESDSNEKAELAPHETTSMSAGFSGMVQPTDLPWVERGPVLRKKPRSHASESERDASPLTMSTMRALYSGLAGTWYGLENHPDLQQKFAQQLEQNFSLRPELTEEGLRIQEIDAVPKSLPSVGNILTLIADEGYLWAEGQKAEEIKRRAENPAEPIAAASAEPEAATPTAEGENPPAPPLDRVQLLTLFGKELRGAMRQLAMATDLHHNKTERLYATNGQKSLTVEKFCEIAEQFQQYYNSLENSQGLRLEGAHPRFRQVLRDAVLQETGLKLREHRESAFSHNTGVNLLSRTPETVEQAQEALKNVAVMVDSHCRKRQLEVNADPAMDDAERARVGEELKVFSEDIRTLSNNLIDGMKEKPVHRPAVRR